MSLNIIAKLFNVLASHIQYKFDHVEYKIVFSIGTFYSIFANDYNYTNYRSLISICVLVTARYMVKILTRNVNNFHVHVQA